MKKKKKLAGKWLREMSRECMKPGATRIVADKKRRSKNVRRATRFAVREEDQ